jgi:ABC-type multidrug transport system ATPase subunit
MNYQIQLKDVAKRYEQSWIFKDVSYSFHAGNRYVILGNNGSGKSTLLRCIANIHDINKGELLHLWNGEKIKSDKIFQQISYCAPGMELIEEMTLLEFLKFHFSFKSILTEYSIDDIFKIIQLEKHKHTLLRNCSSGMKQRVKLAQAFFSQTQVILLDEPCTNLDAQGIQLYQDLLASISQASDRIVIIASNDEREFPDAIVAININDYK